MSLGAAIESARQPTCLRRARDGACRRSSASAYHGADGAGHSWEAPLPEKRAVLSEGCGLCFPLPVDAIIVIPSEVRYAPQETRAPVDGPFGHSLLRALRH